MKKKAVKKEPPPGSPLARAKRLDHIARQPAPDTTGLPEKERLYVEKLHGHLVRYWHREISGEELAAHRNLLVAHLLCESQKSYYTRLWTKKGDTYHAEKTKLPPDA